jgi:hypothetical protein
MLLYRVRHKRAQKQTESPTAGSSVVCHTLLGAAPTVLRCIAHATSLKMHLGDRWLLLSAAVRLTCTGRCTTKQHMANTLYTAFVMRHKVCVRTSYCCFYVDVVFWSEAEAAHARSWASVCLHGHRGHHWQWLPLAPPKFGAVKCECCTSSAAERARTPWRSCNSKSPAEKIDAYPAK